MFKYKDKVRVKSWFYEWIVWELLEIRETYKNTTEYVIIMNDWVIIDTEDSIEKLD
jgi:hypothetical protein